MDLKSQQISVYLLFQLRQVRSGFCSFICFLLAHTGRKYFVGLRTFIIFYYGISITNINNNNKTSPYTFTIMFTQFYKIPFLDFQIGDKFFISLPFFNGNFTKCINVYSYFYQNKVSYAKVGC